MFPVHAEAHALPFAGQFFDRIVAVDSYQHFGTDQLYLRYLAGFLKSSGRVGIVVPGLHRPLHDREAPGDLTRRQRSGGTFWVWEMCTSHTARWWHDLWSAYPFVDQVRSEAMPDGGHVWLAWEQALASAPGKKAFPSDVEVFTEDANRYLTFIRVTANRNSFPLD